MRDLVIVEFTSVDGVMQGLGSPDEDTDAGFSYGGWGQPYAAALHEVLADGPARTSGYVLGRRTFEKMAAFWPHQPDTDPMASHLNATPKYVATRTLTEFGWQPTQALAGELEPAVRALKAEDEGDLVVLGSGVLTEQLLRLGLVDELRLFVHPLLLGTGKRLFRHLPEPRPLELTSSAATSMGTLALTYRFRDS